jgi:hypothetical protein
MVLSCGSGGVETPAAEIEARWKCGACRSFALRNRCPLGERVMLMPIETVRTLLGK